MAVLGPQLPGLTAGWLQRLYLCVCTSDPCLSWASKIQGKHLPQTWLTQGAGG